MFVRDLIEKLEKLDQNAEVMLAIDEGHGTTYHWAFAATSELLLAVAHTPAPLISLANQNGFKCIETWRNAARQILGRAAYHEAVETAIKPKP